MSITFSGAKRRYVLELEPGAKVQTRRIDAKQLPCSRSLRGIWSTVLGDRFHLELQYRGGAEKRVTPRYKPGKVYPVSEAIRRSHSFVMYEADLELATDGMSPYRWQAERDYLPGFLMAHKFARQWVRVDAVRIERLGDISEEDARLEGAEGKGFVTAASDFTFLWNCVNGQGSWERDKDCLVWVYDLTVCSRADWLEQQDGTR